MLYQSERSSRWKLTADETNGEKSHELSTPSFLRHDSRSLRLRSTMCAPVHSSPPSLYSEIDPRAPNFPRSPLVSRIFRLPCVQAIPSSVCVRRRVSSTFFHERKEEKLVTFEKKKKTIRYRSGPYATCIEWMVGSFVGRCESDGMEILSRQRNRLANGRRRRSSSPFVSGWGGNVAMGKRGVDNEIRLGRELEELRSDDSRKV